MSASVATLHIGAKEVGVGTFCWSSLSQKEGERTDGSGHLILVWVSEVL